MTDTKTQIAELEAYSKWLKSEGMDHASRQFTTLLQSLKDKDAEIERLERRVSRLETCLRVLDEDKQLLISHVTELKERMATND